MLKFQKWLDDNFKDITSIKRVYTDKHFFTALSHMHKQLEEAVALLDCCCNKPLVEPPCQVCEYRKKYAL